MNLRIVLLGVAWLFVMTLLFFTSDRDTTVYYFDTIPSRSIIHGLLMWGFVHIWIAALKKQLKHEYLKKNAFKIVFASAIILAVGSELAVYSCQLSSCFSIWNLIFDILGACMGIISFRILYSQCY